MVVSGGGNGPDGSVQDLSGKGIAPFTDGICGRGDRKAGNTQIDGVFRQRFISSMTAFRWVKSARI
jgi:hypothetical protein